MSSMTTKDSKQIYYKECGEGRPVVYSHGWPLNANAWDAQVLFLLQLGCPVIVHDRCGHGPRGGHGKATTWICMSTIWLRSSIPVICARPRWSITQLTGRGHTLYWPP
jgi:pimeloyl-ACP methyl ester carboxylesterase